MRSLYLYLVAALVVCTACGGDAFVTTGPSDATADVTAQTDAGGSCTPKLCPDLKRECDTADNGCGAAIDCGRCSQAGFACVSGKCECRTKTCQQQGAECGTVPDGCGNTLLCPKCPDGQTCGGGGDHRCGTNPCTPIGCNGRCGIVSDGCGSTIDCGNTCRSPQTCGGGGTPGQCGCTGKTCAQLGWQCGSGDDGCGNTVTCPACTGANEACDLQSHKCVCKATTTCQSAGYACGAFVDECGVQQRCGLDPVRDANGDEKCLTKAMPKFYRCACFTPNYVPAPPLPVDGGAIPGCSGPTPPMPGWSCVALDSPATAWCCQ